MAVDLNEFILANNLNSHPLFILGHSMGAKVGLLYSLLCGEDISGIISLDASPTSYYHNHQRIFDAMKAIDFNQVFKKYDVDQQLKKHGIIDASERGFVMDNLQTSDGNEWSWKCNLNVISKNEHNVHGFPDSKHMAIYDKHSLFVGGTVGSDRLTNNEYIQDLNFWFPSNTIKLFDGGHFVHRTHFKQVQHEVTEYIKKMMSTE